MATIERVSAPAFTGLPLQEELAGDVEQLWDLHNLARAKRLIDWTCRHVHRHARGAVAEVGAGIGTYSDRLLANGAERLVLLEPDDICAGVLDTRFADDPRVIVAKDAVPDAPTLAEHAGRLDAVVSQNVIEHIEDDFGAVEAMAGALRHGGVVSLQVPAHPKLYNELDRVYGHYRRYDRAHLRNVVEAAGLEVIEMRSFNLLGVLGWLSKRRNPDPSISAGALKVYETLVPLWRPFEEALRPRWGLSLLVHARRV
jgi:SAM-dependent methyltransferase